MKKNILAILLALLGSFGLNAQVLYEDFEGGSGLTWLGLNGVYDGAVPNPGPDAVNGSATVGSYTNVNTFDFCFNVANLSGAVDMTEFNQFKMKVWSPVATGKILFKLEPSSGGPASEKFVDITVANQWVEYTFDLSGGTNITNLDKIVLSFNSFVFDASTFYFDDIRAVKAVRTFEDFETPSGINWTSINGTYNGAIPNPGPNQVNNSATVGSFTNNPAESYSFAFGTFATPLDLTNFNQFRVHLLAPQPTQLLFKIEGTGEDMEKVVNVAVSDKWQEYNFDFSGAADFTTITKFLVAFSPGESGSDATYYIDNIYAVPDQCPDTDPDPDVIDDFDCNRNAVYSAGWDSLVVINNPDVDGDNASKKVGQWNRPAGNGTEYAALVIDYENPIDLSVRNQFSAQVWAPKTGKMLLKIEGPNGAKEYLLDITEANKWVTYTADFSSRIGLGDNKFVLFFGATVNGEAGDVYYIDNIKLSAPTELAAIEDFQGTELNLGWLPLDGNAPLHGNFSGPTANANPGGVNTSTQAGCYSKGASPFSTLQVLSVNAFDLSTFPQFNIDILSPATAVADQTSVTFQLVSATIGTVEATARVQTPGVWETLSFDFSTYGTTADFQEIHILFDPGTVAFGQSWCIDNLRQGLTTTDPCADVVPNPNIIDDFECQRNYTNIFYGADDLAVVNNPHLNADNQSIKVGEYNDPTGAYAGIGFQFPASPDLSVYNQLQVKVWSPTANVPFLFKLQGGQGQYEVFDTSDVANKWHTFLIDFSNSPGSFSNGTQLVIFLNVGNDAGGGTYYVDDVAWKRKGYNGCILDFETPATTITQFNYFDQGSYNQPFEVVNNPASDAINNSSKVGKFVKPSDGGNFTGIYTDLDAPVDFEGLKEMHAKIWMDHLDTFVLKLEQDKSGLNLPPTEIAYANTTINQWENTTHNFATAPDNAKYYRFTIFFDWKKAGNGTSNVISYFDDISIGANQCGIVGTWHPIPVEPMVISPNPVSTILRVENFRDINRLEVFNAYGQRVMTQNTNLDARVDVDVAALPPGVYLLTGYNAQGILIGNAKFIKQ